MLRYDYVIKVAVSIVFLGCGVVFINYESILDRNIIFLCHII